ERLSPCTRGAPPPVPQPNLTKSMYSAADETRSAKCATPIPPSMTIVRPVLRGLEARGGNCKAFGFIVTPSHLDSCCGVGQTAGQPSGDRRMHPLLSGSHLIRSTGIPRR